MSHGSEYPLVEQVQNRLRVLGIDDVRATSSNVPFGADWRIILSLSNRMVDSLFLGSIAAEEATERGLMHQSLSTSCAATLHAAGFKGELASTDMPSDEAILELTERLRQANSVFNARVERLRLMSRGPTFTEAIPPEVNGLRRIGADA